MSFLPSLSVGLSELSSAGGGGGAEEERRAREEPQSLRGTRRIDVLRDEGGREREREREAE